MSKPAYLHSSCLRVHAPHGNDRTRGLSRISRIIASSQICCKTFGRVSHFAPVLRVSRDAVDTPALTFETAFALATVALAALPYGVNTPDTPAPVPPCCGREDYVRWHELIRHRASTVLAMRVYPAASRLPPGSAELPLVVFNDSDSVWTHYGDRNLHRRPARLSRLRCNPRLVRRRQFPLLAGREGALQLV